MSAGDSDWRALPRRQSLRNRPGNGGESRHRDRFRCVTCGQVAHVEIAQGGRVVEVTYDERGDRWRHGCPVVEPEYVREWAEDRRRDPGPRPRKPKP